MKKISFLVKQILPLTYVSKYRSDGKKYLTVWKQWFGKLYNVHTYTLLQQTLNKINSRKD